MLSQLNGLPESEELLDECVHRLQTWAVDNRGALKRCRCELMLRAQYTWNCDANPSNLSASDAFEQIVQSGPKYALEVAKKMVKARKADKSGGSRADTEAAERMRFAMELSVILKEACTPVVYQIEQLDNQNMAWERIFGSRRAKTLRNRFRAWSKYRMWLVAFAGVVWPRDITDLVNYRCMVNYRLRWCCWSRWAGSFWWSCIDYRLVALGITEKRGAWLLEFLETLRNDRFTIHIMRRFAEFLGRLGFPSRVLCWMKPHLAPLCTCSAALDKGTVATMPKMVRLVCLYLEQQLKARSFMYSCNGPKSISGDLFRTDAKCESGRVTLGGYHLTGGQWFSLSVGSREAPYLLKENGDSQWASAPSELLVALWAFGFLNASRERRSIDLWVQGGTDDRSIGSFS